MTTTTTPPRQPLPLDRLTRYLSQNHPTIPLPLQSVRQFQHGQSNPTYLLTAAATGDGSTTTPPRRYVLRKKPPGGAILSPRAHDVGREYGIMRAVAEAAPGRVPVPKMLGFCADESVLGTAFFLMEFVEGRVFADERFEGVKEDERREM